MTSENRVFPFFHSHREIYNWVLFLVANKELSQAADVDCILFIKKFHYGH